jgi:hypothetical protein
MKLRFLLSIRVATLGLALALAAGAAIAQDTVWTNTYSNGAGDVACVTALSPDSTVVVAGRSYNATTDWDIVVRKLNRTTGEEIWLQRWASVVVRDEPRAIAIDDSGSIFVVGLIQAGSDSDFVTLKFTADGTFKWWKNYDLAGVDVATEVIADNMGGAYVAGHSSRSPGNTNQDYMLIHYDSSGTVLWSSRLNGAGDWHDYPTAMVRDDSGYLYVTGFSWTGATPQYDYLTVKYDPLDGDTIWTRLYDGTALAPKTDMAHDITLDDSGYLYVTGTAGEAGTWFDGTTIKYSRNGDQIWVNRFDPSTNGTDGATHVRVDANYNVYCGGWTWDANDWPDYLVYRINQRGGVVENPWFRTYDGGVEDSDSLVAMTVDPRGNVYVTGSSYVYAGDADWVTFKYDANGTKLWSATYASSQMEDDEPMAMAMDEHGDLYVSGFTLDVPSQRLLTVKYTEEDVGAFRVVLPDDSFRLGATVTPRAWVRNYSSLTSTRFPVRFEVGHFYSGSAMSETIPPQDSVLITFDPPWSVLEDALGTHDVKCYTMLDGDKEVSNDTSYSQVTGVRVWERLPDVPIGLKGRAVQFGGALGFATDSNVYAFKGNNTVEFYMYGTKRDSWFERESIPASATGSRKRVKAGAHLEGDTLGSIYAIKGNNTLEFWKYSVAGRAWTQQPDYPAGAGKRLKSGSDLAFVPQKNAVYGCKGNNTAEFNAFDIATGAWLPKSPVPLGPAGNKKVKDGSAMAYDGAGTIYLLKGGTLEFYGYSVARDSWYQKKDIRYSGHSYKKRKMKKGASAAFDTRFGLFYALKGGKSGEFWFFDPARDTWVEPAADSFPTPPGTKLPYAGAHLSYGAGKIFALRGNKTNEFWRYNANFPLGYGSPVPGPQAQTISLPRLRFSVAPNPFAGRTTVRYSLPLAGHVRLVLYDAAGRQARIVYDGWQPRGEYVTALTSDGLAAGVYIARLRLQDEAGAQETVRKVLVTR